METMPRQMPPRESFARIKRTVSRFPAVSSAKDSREALRARPTAEVARG